MRRDPWSAPARPLRRGPGWLLLGLLLLVSGGVRAGGDWILRGTLVLGEGRGYAIVEHADAGGQRARRVGDWLVPGMRLEAVATDHALVSEQGRTRRLVFGTRLQAEPSPPRGDGTFRLDPRRLPEIMAAIDVIPHQQNGRIDGYYANAIPEPLREGLGLQPGDLLRRVNGIPLDDRVDAGQLYRALDSGRLAVDIERRGRRLRLVYRLDG